ncbi:RNA methyltransferase [Bacteroidota bacterium]
MRKLKTNELNRPSIEEFKKINKLPLVIVLDNLRSHYNIGSVFRTSDAFKIEQIILCGISAKPPHRDIQKTALGATESVAWKYFENTRDAILELKKKDYKVYGMEQTDHSVMIYDFIPDPKEKISFVFGNEVKGLSNDILELLDACIEIPQFGTKHSLNVSVSAGIMIWDYFLKIS